jgi:hypothetical protein
MRDRRAVGQPRGLDVFAIVMVVYLPAGRELHPAADDHRKGDPGLGPGSGSGKRLLRQSGGLEGIGVAAAIPVFDDAASTQPIQARMVGGNPRAAFTATPDHPHEASGAFSAILSPDERARTTGALYPGL